MPRVPLRPEAGQGNGGWDCLDLGLYLGLGLGLECCALGRTTPETATLPSLTSHHAGGSFLIGGRSFFSVLGLLVSVTGVLPGQT